MVCVLSFPRNQSAARSAARSRNEGPMPLKDLIASPGEAAAARIIKRFRFSGEAREELYVLIRDEVDRAVKRARQEAKPNL